MLRADAQRNRTAVIAAAREVFAEQGLEAPLEEIAVEGQLVRSQVGVAAAEAALATANPWDGLVSYLEETGRLQAADRSFNDMMSMRLPPATKAEAAKARLFALTEAIIGQAQASGQLRADVTSEDLAFLAWANTRIMQATQGIAPDAWRRHLGLLLDGLRAERAHPLPVPPLSPRQVYRAMRSLGSRCTGGAQA